MSTLQRPTYYNTVPAPANQTAAETLAAEYLRFRRYKTRRPDTRMPTTLALAGGLAGDFDGDGDVDVQDLLWVISHWGQLHEGEIIGVPALLVVISNFGSSTQTVMDSYGISAPVITSVANVSTGAEFRAACMVPGRRVNVLNPFSISAPLLPIPVASNVKITGNNHLITASGGALLLLNKLTTKVWMDQIRLKGGAAFTPANGTGNYPSHIAFTNGDVEHTARYFDLENGINGCLIYNTNCRNSQEYSVWGNFYVKLFIDTCEFVGNLNQTMIRLYEINQFTIIHSTVQATVSGKQTIRMINGTNCMVEDCTLIKGRVTFGNWQEPWGLDGFSFKDNICNWEGETGNAIEVQPGATNGTLTGNFVTSPHAFDYGIWQGPGECPNVSWTGNFRRTLNSQSYSPVPNGSTP